MCGFPYLRRNTFVRYQEDSMQTHSVDCYVSVYPHVRLRAQICRCYTKHIPLPTVLQALIYDYINKNPAYSVCAANKLLTMPLYNIPVHVTENEGPERTVVEISDSSRSAIALNGYNHTSQGIAEIGLWLDGMLVDRPQELVLFQPMFGSLVSTVYETPGSTFVSVPDPDPIWMNWLDKSTPDKRMLFLSAFDALNAMSETSQSECKGREARYVPPPNEIDVLFVHRIAKAVHVDTRTLFLNGRYRNAQTKVSCSQILRHVVISSHVVYVGNMSSCYDPVDSSSKTDFIRLIVLQTEMDVLEGYFW